MRLTKIDSQNANLREYFRGKKVLIMGLGRLGGGENLVRFFVEEGATVTVTDLKSKNELAQTIARLKDLPIKYILGKHRLKDFKGQDLIIRNPDVPQDSEFLKEARKNNIPVEMDESLFLKLCPVPVVGVTGTRGKTTTTILIGEILKEAGYHTLLGGNLPGVATLALLRQINPQTKVVLELSSWQLQGLSSSKISPHIALVTNIYPDHLNRYKNMEEYITDKKVIFKYQTKEDFLILNKENEVVYSFAKEAKAKVIWFEKSNWPENWPLKILGGHNRENAAAARVVAKIFGVNDEIIKRAVGQFKGVKFRLEKIAVRDGITYINDTTSTTPIAGVMALRALRPKPIILIAGGNSKNLDLTDFAREISRSVKAVVLLEGTATDDLESRIKSVKVGSAHARGRSPLADSGGNYESRVKILGRFDNLKEAILMAKKMAKPGDVILLSPGCTSFGMFKNEFDRGEQFEALVKALP